MSRVVEVPKKLGFRSDPVTFRYRSNKGPVTVRGVVQVMGEVPAYSSTYYVLFYDKDKKLVGRCAESRLLGDGARKYREVFGRPWWNKIYRPGLIELRPYEDYCEQIGGLPDDTVLVWSICNIPDGHKYGCPIKHDWVIERSVGATLHILNNREITRRAPTFNEALRKLFPDHRIKIVTPKISYTEEVLECSVDSKN